MSTHQPVATGISSKARIYEYTEMIMIREHVGKEQSETNDLCLYMGVYAYICGTIYTRILQKKKDVENFAATVLS